MQELSAYRIQIQGYLEEKNFNAMSPYRITNVRAGQETTSFQIHADQAGLIGLLRHLHQQGYLLISVQRNIET